MSIFVVVPTYNERENLSVLTTEIFKLKIPNLKMIVVDDNSPDGTGAIADELAKKYPITVMHRKTKNGLGVAYGEAFHFILSTHLPDKEDYIIQMDADLSHDPAVIPSFLQNIKNADLVLGSRYIKGGAITNWNFFRRLISRFGNLYASFVLQVPYCDLTSGYKCYRRRVLENINLSDLSSIGYNFQIETTYRAHQKNYKIVEIPIIFTERKLGASKFKFGIFFESFWKVLMLRFTKK